ncbi:MAG: Holliday junction resolvase RuvX [bacterium]
MSKGRGRILAIDYGEKKIGIAVSDPLGIIAQGLPTIVYKSRREALHRIKQVAQEYEVVEVIVGHPLNAHGEASVVTMKTQAFSNKLKAEVGLPVLLWDERFTSVEARRALLQMNLSPSRNKLLVDRVSATLILQNYLNYVNR